MILAVLITICLASTATYAGDKVLTFADLMKFEEIHDPVISGDGAWIAYALAPDRGDGTVIARAANGDTEYRIELGSHPQISSDGKWVVAVLEPTLEEQDKASKSKSNGKNDKPKKGLSLLDLGTGDELRLDAVKSFALSEDGKWLAYLHHRNQDDDESESPQSSKVAAKEESSDDSTASDEHLGSTLMLRSLDTGEELEISFVTVFGFDEPSTVLAYAVSAPEGQGNGLFRQPLNGTEAAPKNVHSRTSGSYSELVWAHEQSRLAFVTSVRDDDGELSDAEIWTWEPGTKAAGLVSAKDVTEGFVLPVENELEWSRDGNRLFFGFAVAPPEDEEPAKDEDAPFDPYDIEGLVADAGVDIWHWNDPLIIPNQKKRWKEHEKNRTYKAVVHLKSERIVQLATLEMPEVDAVDNSRVALAGSRLPYLKEVTWDGGYGDAYVVDLDNGEASLVANRLAVGWRSRPASLSPQGGWVLYYNAGDWHLYEVSTAVTKNLTENLEVPFANEDHDYPADPPGYGHSEWLSDDSGVLIYDKYDIWQLSTKDASLANLTNGRGRATETTFRVIDQDEETDWIEPGGNLLLSACHDKEKHFAFYAAQAGGLGVRPLYETRAHKVDFVARADKADRVLFTRQSYTEFPNLWISDSVFADPTRLSDVNPQIEEYAWGEAELVEWSSADGVPLQGILIKPGNYEPGQRYPVLVYYYRLFSQRLHAFNQPVVNHRPSFPVYASNGYAVFLPDIRFEVGQPGFSATKCLVPGVQKLVDMGIADPDAIGLHGHSWSGYQTAFVITQSNIFAAAVAGAPVSNMTSAYSGIRHQTGLARQFQYEKSQSRIGGSLWEYPERYIENSPVFFADRINTPLLIQFGDEDGAVPWEQGIELYLACRRLGKECIFLQYRGEPHHLKKYPNKVDYSIKMKQFFDHHLKGVPAPKWMTEGVPYRGK